MSKTKRMIGIILSALVVSSMALTGCQGNETGDESSLSSVSSKAENSEQSNEDSGVLNPLSSESEDSALSKRIIKLKKGLESGEFTLEMKQTVSTMNVSVKVVTKGDKCMMTMTLLDRPFQVLIDGKTSYLVGSDEKTLYKSKTDEGSDSLNEMFSVSATVEDFGKGLTYKSTGKETIDGQELDYEEYEVSETPDDVDKQTESSTNSEVEGQDESSSTTGVMNSYIQRYYFKDDKLVRIRSLNENKDIQSDTIVSKFEFKLSDDELKSLDAKNYTISDESAEDMLSKMMYTDTESLDSDISVSSKEE